MKKFVAVILSVLTLPAMADDDVNPLFGADNENNIAIYAAQGTGPGTMFKLVDPFLWEFESMTSVMIQYSQPLNVFRLPSRMNWRSVCAFAKATMPNKNDIINNFNIFDFISVKII